jgi:hypothetical protein
VKKSHLLLLLILTANTLFAQTIIDLNFAKAIRSQCPDCLNDKNELEEPAQKVAYLDVNFKGICDLTGIEGFSSLMGLDCSNNNLSQLPFLPNPYLKQIRCANNFLTALPLLPESLLSLDCSGNKISYITSLPNALLELTINSNPIRQLPQLPTYLQKLSCVGDSLTELPVLPDDISVLNCAHNQLRKLPKLPAQLSKMILDNNQLEALPSLPYLLVECSVVDNNLTSLPNLPDYLQVLDVSKNQLDKLPSLPPRLAILRFAQNKIAKIYALPGALIELDCRYNFLIDLPKLPRRLTILRLKGNFVPCLGNMPEKLTTIDEQDMEECPHPHFGLIEKGVDSSAQKILFQTELVTTTATQLVPYRKGAIWGFSNARGEIMIPPQYESASLFEKNPHFCYSFAIISIGGVKGVIDVEGDYIVPPDYQKVHALNRGGFIAQKTPNDNWVHITEDAIVEQTFTEEVAKDPIFKQYIGNKATIAPRNAGKFVFTELLIPEIIRNDSAQVGYILQKKTILNRATGAFKLETIYSIPPQYSELKYLSVVNFDTLLAKDNQGKWGIINAKNEIIAPFIYDDIKKDMFKFIGKNAVQATYLTGKKNGKWGICSLEDGSLILDYDFDEVQIFALQPLNNIGGKSNRLFMKVRKGRFWGLMSEQLWQWIVPTEFDDVRLDVDTQNGFQLLKGKQMGYYIIPAEKTILPYYKEVKYFKHGFAEVVTIADKIGFINENGDEYFLD